MTWKDADLCCLTMAISWGVQKQQIASNLSPATLGDESGYAMRGERFQSDRSECWLRQELNKWQCKSSDLLGDCKWTWSTIKAHFKCTSIYRVFHG